MGRIFISAGRSSTRLGLNALGNASNLDIDVQELSLVRDLVLQNLRSRNYDAVSVPDDLDGLQTADWINHRAHLGDVALEIRVDRLRDAAMRGATVFYIANNDQRKTQAEQLLQAYLRRIPQMPSRGAKPDFQTEMGRLVFCRQVSVPSLLIEIGSLIHPEERRLLQTHRQDVALGIAEGLAAWSRAVASTIPENLPAEIHIPTTYPVLDITVNGAAYEDKGVLIEGNAYVPVDLIDQLGVDLPLDRSIRRVTYRNVVFVRAIDLREFNISIVNHSNERGTQTRSINLRTVLSICPSQLDRIMGQGVTSEVQMMMFLKSHSSDGLSRFPDLPKLYREEASIEGVNYDIAFAQMCVETNFLRFGGAIKPEQHNFAGLGAMGSGNEGASFSSSRIGVRSQIQHLKAYASTEPLVQAVVDPRFQYIRRGIAPTVTQLSGRWSADPHYHLRIIAVLRRLYESAGFL